jgi:DNA-binding transcriptional LysR family regulator
MYDWSDLRFFLAVARTGSTMAASRQMRVSQATVSRRLSVFEETLGLQLFTRRPTGYTLTAKGEALRPLAEAVETAADRFCNAAGAEERRLFGRVRLTTVESAANSWVIPALATLRDHHPEIEVELITGEDILDLAGGEADVAIRFGAQPTQDSLVVRRLAELDDCFYASQPLVARIGFPANFAELSRYPIVGETQMGARFTKWIADNMPDARVVQRVNSLSGVLACVRAGIGAALMPCVMGDYLNGLVRLVPPIKELSTPCWMVTTDHARSQPHVRAVIDFVVAHIEAATAHGISTDRQALSA